MDVVHDEKEVGHGEMIGILFWLLACPIKSVSSQSVNRVPVLPVPEPVSGQKSVSKPVSVVG